MGSIKIMIHGVLIRYIALIGPRTLSNEIRGKVPSAIQYDPTGI